MKCNSLTRLDKKVGSKIAVRRYNLSDMISESYQVLYACDDETNLKKLVESHLEDVRKNPRDIERLSRQLCVIKEALRLTESGNMKDSELLVPEESHDTVEPKEARALDLEESKTEVVSESVQEEGLMEDTELTDEELEELSKHLEEIRKKKGVTECDDPKTSTEVKESSTKARNLKRRTNEAEKPSWSRFRIVNTEGETIDSYTDRKDAEEWVKQLYKDGDYKRGDLSIVDSQSNSVREDKDPSPDLQDMIMTQLSDLIYGFGVDPNSLGEMLDELVYNIAKLAPSKNESKSYAELNLSEFNKKSSSKAFVKTFKKLDSKLHEGTALTRQESISLYKAANSAMTHLSVELEHNPEFLETFKESVSLLSIDVSKLLNSLSEGKAPSKATMKSLAKFSEALLREDEEEEDLPPIEDEEEEFIMDDEGDMISEEEEEFDQEYAEARVELHKELAEEHADSEDPAVQDKITQDAEEIVSLPGITEEQIAEVTGEESETAEEETEETPEEEQPEDVEIPEEEVEEGNDSEITDDELAELKRYLKEMRTARRSK